MSEANPQNTDCRKARQNLGDRPLASHQPHFGYAISDLEFVGVFAPFVHRGAVDLRGHLPATWGGH